MHNKIYAIPIEVMQGTGEEVNISVLQVLHVNKPSKTAECTYFKK